MSDYNPNYKPLTSTEAKDSGNASLGSLLTKEAALGAGNQLLFGLPEAAVKALSDEKTRNAIEEWKARNPSYATGEAVGALGSMLTPSGLIAKGAGKLAGKAGLKTLETTLAKVGKAASGPAGFAQGVASAAEQAVPRAFAGLVGGEKPQDVLAELGTGVALGGGIGKVLQGVGKVGKAIGQTSLGKNLKDEAEKMVEDAVLAGTDVTTGIIRKAAMNSARRLGLDKTTASFNTADKLKKQMVDLVTENKLLGRQEREAFLEEQGPLFQKVAEKYNARPLDFKNEDLLKSILDDEGVKEYLTTKAVGPEKVQSILSELVGDLETRPDWNQAKKYLTNKQRVGRMAGNEEGDALTEIASALEDAIVKHTQDVAPEYREIAARYPAVKAFKMASGAEKAEISSPLQQGSNTAQKLMLASAGGALGASTAPDQDKILYGLAGAAGAPFAERILSRGGAQLLGGLASKIPGVAEKVGPVVSQTGKTALERSPQALGPAQVLQGSQDQGQAVPASMPGAGAGAGKDEMARIDAGIDQAWQMEDPRGLIEESAPGSKQQFADEIKKSLINPDGSVNYLRAGKILFPQQPEAAKAFKEAYTQYSRLQQTLATATASNPLKLDPKTKADRQAVVDTVSEVMKKQGMGEADAKKIVTEILGNLLITPQDKQARIMYLLKTADPFGFGDNGVLKYAGVLK